MKILFLIQRSKINKNGLVPVMCRLTYLKQRKEFSTRLMVASADWINSNKLLKSSSSNDVVNSELEMIHQKLHKAYLQLKIREFPFGIEDIMVLYNGKTTRTEYGIIQVYNEHNEYYKKLIGKDIKQVSWQKFENTKGHLHDFLKWKFEPHDLKLSKLRFQFISDFEFYLRTEKLMQQSTINKTLQRFKKMISFAVAHNYLGRNPFLMHKLKSIRKDVVYLTKQELSCLQDKEINNTRLEEVRDCFVFCCYTGLAFKEMSNLRSFHIIEGKDGRNWIKMTRQKTDKLLSVPLLPRAQELLDKYKDRLTGDDVLPSKTNSHFNAYLKEIAALCDVKLNLTHHIARKTFATTVLLLNDVPIEIVSKLLGHTRIGITQAHYGHILDEKVEMEINRISNRF